MHSKSWHWTLVNCQLHVLARDFYRDWDMWSRHAVSDWFTCVVESSADWGLLKSPKIILIKKVDTCPNVVSLSGKSGSESCFVNVAIT